MKLLVLIFLTLLYYQVTAESVKNSSKYVFYLHGAIIEQGDLRPTHPDYGLYDYPAIVSALSKYDFYLIAEQREKNTDLLSYAQYLVSEINQLIASGVEPSDITVIGFSKGAMITTIASSLLENEHVNFAIIAICGPWYDSYDSLKNLRLKGHIFSIYEETDSSGSCRSLSNRLPKPASFTEVAINTGKDHGAFFLPRNEWIKPLIAWINRESSGYKSEENQ